MKLKLILGGLGAMVAAVLAVLRGRNPWKERAEKAAEEAKEAKHDAVDAEADADLEEVAHDLEDDLDDIDDMFLDDLYADAERRSRGPQ